MTLRTLLFSPFLVCLLQVSAQGGTSPFSQPVRVDLSEAFGVNADNGAEPIGQRYPNRTAMAKAFPNWTAYCMEHDQDDAGVLRTSFFVAAWNDAVLRFSGGPAVIDMELPAGSFSIDRSLLLVEGIFRGRAGANERTTLIIDPAAWHGEEPAIMRTIPAPDGGLPGSGLQLMDLHLMVQKPAQVVAGNTIGVRVEGTSSPVFMDRVSFRGFNDAVLMAEADAARLSDVELIGNINGISMLGCTGDQYFEHITGSENGVRFRVGSWGAVAARNVIHATDVRLFCGSRAMKGVGTDRLLSADGDIRAEFFDVLLITGKVVPSALCMVTGTLPGSFITAHGVVVDGQLSTLVRDKGQDRTFARLDPSDPEPFDLSWTHEAPEGTLSETVPGSYAGDQNGRFRSDEGNGQQHGTLKSLTSAISIGALTGEPLPALKWGYNTADAFALYSGTDPLLVDRVEELEPQLLRYPGGTLANFTHPTGLAYGLKLSEIQLVAGTEVYNSIHSRYLGEQADIEAGLVSGNYLQDMIDLALTTDRSVLYVANLLTGTVSEMTTTLHAMLDAGVNVVGVELGNESHLKAFDFRFSNDVEYLAVATPYAQALDAQFPNLKYGLNAYPSGIIKDMGPTGTAKALAWNVMMSNSAYGDALIVHCYSRAPNCNQGSVTPNFNCGAEFSDSYVTEKVPAALSELAGLGNKKVWVTEWNIDGDYSHYGNSLSQAMFYADMSLTMAQQPDVTISSYHNLVAYDKGYNVLVKGWQTCTPMITYHASQMMKDLYLPGNMAQTCTVDQSSGIRAFAFRSAEGIQHLYLVNRSGSEFDLSGFQGTATNVTATTLGGTDLASGTGPNWARPNGDLEPVTIVVPDIHQVVIPAYGIAHLTWAAPIVSTQPIWGTSFTGSENCRLVATTGADVQESNSGRCATISGGKIVTQSSTSFSYSVTVKRIVFTGITFQDVSNGKWINSRLRIWNGHIYDRVTSEDLGVVQAGQYVSQLTVEFPQPVSLVTILGKPSGGTRTALMTIKAMDLYP